MTKKKQRQEILAWLRVWSPEEKALVDQGLLERLLKHDAYRQAQTVATYLSLPHEWQTAPFIERALSDGKQVVVPKLVGDAEMIFVPYRSDELTEGALGILSPTSHDVVDKSEIDLIHVPGLLFNRQGYRIGYGGGFYDRYLADYEGMTLATVYEKQLCHFTPEPHDIAVKELIYSETNP